MAKFFVLILCSIVIYSCGGGSDGEDPADEESPYLKWDEGQWNQKKWK